MPSKKTKIGKVYLIGAGPGDPGLLTVKGFHLLSCADIVFYDNLVNPKILETIPPKAEQVYVGKRGEGKSSDQKEIEDQIVSAAKKGKVVIRLKGGDPFIFGRGGEEAERLFAEKIPFEIVPGVTSPIAVPAYAGIPLTHRDFASTVVFVTGHSRSKKREKEILSPSPLDRDRADTTSLDWPSLVKMDTLVFVMGVKTIRENMQHLIEAGRNPKELCALIRWGTYSKQKTWISTIDQIGLIVEKEKIMPPAILVVGEVVKLREKIEWFENRPLFGKRIVVTRAKNQVSSLSDELVKLGAEVIEVPTIEIFPPISFKKLDLAIRKIEKYDWLIFTSVHGVRFFFQRFKKCKKDLRALSKIKIAAVGPTTGKLLAEFGYSPDFTPKKFSSDSLGEYFLKLPLKNKKILIPQAKEAKRDWIETLKLRKAKVENVEAYQSQLPNSHFKELKRIKEICSADLITFTASSTVRNAVKLLSSHILSNQLMNIPCLCIGPQTANTAQSLGFKKVKFSKEATLKELVNEVINSFLSY